MSASPLTKDQRLHKPTSRARVVIVGAGFGGLNAARALGDTGVDVLVLDRNNYHGFWPLLYQVATASVEPEAIAYPVRAVVSRYRNVDFQMCEVRGVDLERRQVLTDTGSISYDYLVMAAGSTNNYFGNEALAEQTHGMKDIDEAERLRNHVLYAFERAAAETDADRRAALMTIVIVGGGPTGVELAGALIELIRHTLEKDFPMLDLRKARVVIAEGSDSLLGPFDESLRREARKQLEKMGVEILLGSPVAAVNGDLVTLRDGSTLRAHTVIWAAGVRASRLAETLGVPLARGARVPVLPTLNLRDHPEVFIIGDMSYLEGYQGDGAFPQLAPVAIQQGKIAAENLLALRDGAPLRRFRYRDRGIMATIGRRSAVMQALGLRLTGRLAWFGWLFIHLIELIGFRNRLIVLANWAYNYFTYDRGVRLITR